MTLPVRIVVRTATPWSTMTFADFCAQNDPLLTSMAAQEIRRGKAALIQGWQQAYGMSFCEYRGAVRDACESRLKEVRADTLTIGMKDFGAWLRDGREEIILPIDDDDTFDPSVMSVVDSFDDETNLVLWKRRTNFLGKDRIEAQTRYTDTCNYAIRKSFLTQWIDIEAAIVLSHHWIAASKIGVMLGLAKGRSKDIMGMLENFRRRPFVQGLVHPSVVALDKCHSTYYLHTGSISFLVGGKMARHDNLVDYLRSLPLHPLYVQAR